MVVREGRSGQMDSGEDGPDCMTRGDTWECSLEGSESLEPEGGSTADERSHGGRELALWHFPASPGRQHEQGLPFRTHEHLKHFATPLHRQQRR